MDSSIVIANHLKAVHLVPRNFDVKSASVFRNASGPAARVTGHIGSYRAVVSIGSNTASARVRVYCAVGDLDGRKYDWTGCRKDESGVLTLNQLAIRFKEE